METKITSVNVEPYVVIIKYLNHQKFKVNNEWLADIKHISQDSELKLDTLSVSSEQLSQIKRLEPILRNSTSLQKQDNLHLYYVFIILNLPRYMVKNIVRSYLAKIYLSHQRTASFNYFDIIQRNTYLEDLITILEDTPDLVDVFVESINHFFT